MKKIISILLCMMMIFPITTVKASNTAEIYTQTEKPLLSIAFMSDLHNQQSILVNGGIRGSITDVCNDLANTENVDLVVIGGDVTSDTYVEEPVLKKVLDNVIAETSKVSNNVLWITGNHDYNAGERDGYDSAAYYDYYMKDKVGDLPKSEVYYEEYKGEKKLLAYHYIIKGFDFIGINTAHSDMEGAKQNNNYTYTNGAMEWVDQKLAEIGKEKTVFVMGHFPFRDSNSLSAQEKGLIPSTNEKFKMILTKYQNVFYMYGHDHGTDKAYIQTDTAQRTTKYLTDGSVELPYMEIDDNVVWTVEQTNKGFTFQNVANNKFLGFDGNLNVVNDPENWEVSSDGKGNNIMKHIETGRSLHIGTGNKFSLGSESPVRFYKKVGDRYLNADILEKGLQYVIVANNNFALTNRTNGSTGNNIRMEPLQVQKTEEGISNVELATPSFISSFMGSLRYYNNSIENGPTVENSKVVQNLMVYVYSDRIEFQMKNRGTANGGSWDLKPFLIKRNIVTTYALEEAVAEAEKMDPSSYTKESWDKFDQVLQEAKNVLKKENIKQEDINKALVSLQSASKELVRKPVEEVDKSTLEEAIAEAEKMDSSLYTKESWEIYLTALEVAKAILNKEDVIQEEINNAKFALEKAIKNLEKVWDEKPIKVDKSELNKLIAVSAALNKKDYTAESWAKYITALESAKSISLKEDATQEEVDAAIEILNKLIGELKVVEDNNNNNDNDEKDDTSNGNDSADNKNDELPNTGGNSSVALGLLGIIGALVGGYMTKRKDTKNI